MGQGEETGKSQELAAAIHQSDGNVNVIEVFNDVIRFAQSQGDDLPDCMMDIDKKLYLIVQHLRCLSSHAVRMEDTKLMAHLLLLGILTPKGEVK